MTYRTTLPGALKFWAYLLANADGVLTFEGPFPAGEHGNQAEILRYKILLDGKEIGIYSTDHATENGSYRRTFDGSLPWFRNRHADADTADPHRIILGYSNRRFDGKSEAYETTAWRREDGHDEIQFP